MWRLQRQKNEKIPAWQLTKLRNKKIEEARKKGRKVHFTSLMDLCHLKNSELEPQFHKYKGRVILRGDNVKDDSGSYAVFTEQGSSASHMTAAKVVDIVSRPLQQMQYPLRPRSKWKVHRRCWKFQSQNAQIFGYVYQNTNGQNLWSSMEDPHVLLERNLYGHPLAGQWKRQFGKVLSEHGWEKVPNWECSFVTEKKRRLFLSVYVDEIKLAGKEQNISPTWKILMKDVDLGEPTSFLDHMYLGLYSKRMSDKQGYCG